MFKLKRLTAGAAVLAATVASTTALADHGDGSGPQPQPGRGASYTVALAGAATALCASQAPS